MKIFKIALIIMCILILVFFVVMLVIGNYLYNFAIASNTSKDEIFQKNSEEDILSEEEINGRWIEENSENTYIRTNDNLKLHSYEIKHLNSNLWTIIVHGYGGQGLDMGNYAQNFYQKGYNVLVVDLRGSGLSEGDYLGMGWIDRLDILEWINYLIEKDENCEIILFGVSMGASTVMMTSGEDLPKNVKLAIEDCGYTSVWNEFEYQLEKIFNLNSFPFLNMASLVTKIRAGYFLSEASATKKLEKTKIPILFIHGDRDDFVPSYMVKENYKSTSGKKELLIVKGAEHANSSKIAPTLYWNTVDKFIKKYINT